jgi:hypothetical protein
MGSSSNSRNDGSQLLKYTAANLPDVLLLPFATVQRLCRLNCSTARSKVAAYPREGFSVFLDNTPVQDTHWFAEGTT